MVKRGTLVQKWRKITPGRKRGRGLNGAAAKGSRGTLETEKIGGGGWVGGEKDKPHSGEGFKNAAAEHPTFKGE